MSQKRKGQPRLRTGNRPEISGKQSVDQTTLRAAAVQAFELELSIILQGAHQAASGHRLSWEDCDRLHDAHQHVLRVLTALKGLEVPA